MGKQTTLMMLWTGIWIGSCWCGAFSQKPEPVDPGMAWAFDEAHGGAGFRNAEIPPGVVATHTYRPHLPCGGSSQPERKAIEVGNEASAMKDEADSAVNSASDNVAKTHEEGKEKGSTEVTEKTKEKAVDAKDKTKEMGKKGMDKASYKVIETKDEEEGAFTKAKDKVEDSVGSSTKDESKKKKKYKSKEIDEDDDDDHHHHKEKKSKNKKDKDGDKIEKSKSKNNKEDKLEKGKTKKNKEKKDDF